MITIKIWLIIILVSMMLISATAKAIMDTLKSTLSSSRLKKLKNNQWWDPAISWTNKYKRGMSVLGPRFFGSTTFLVAPTDAWHCMQHIYLIFIFGIPVLYERILYKWNLKTKKWWLYATLIFTIYLIMFELVYRWLNYKHLITGTRLQGRGV